MLQQLSETRKTLFELYSTLRGSLSHNHDEDVQLSLRGSGDEALFVSDVAVTALQWWRTSILHSFATSEYPDLKRQIQLAEDNGISSAECDNRNIDDVTVPICQYSLFGTCSNESCIYRHPTSLRSASSIKPPNLSRTIHCNWLLRENWQQTAVKNSSNLLLKRGSSIVSTVNAGPAAAIFDQDTSHSMATISTSMVDLTEIDHKEQSNKVCRTDAVSDLCNSNTVNTQHGKAWIAHYIKQSKELITTQQVALNNDSGRNIPFSLGPTTSPFLLSSNTATSNLREFCIRVIYGISSDLKLQREICFKSCLQVLQCHLDASISPDILMWEMFLILVVESGMVDTNSTFLVWPRIAQYVMTTMPQSRAITSLVGAVWCRVIIDHTPSLQEIRPGQTTSDCHLAIFSALATLHRICDNGGPELALDALCSRLDLPPLFCPTDQTCSALSDLDALPVDLAFAIFFTLFFTGKCIGKKLYYSRGALYYMDRECNEMASKGVKNMFGRCPSLEDFARDAFSHCFNAMERFQCLDGQGEETSSHSSISLDDIRPHMEVSLSASQQCILWSYHVFIMSQTIDNDAQHEQLKDILKLCDPLCYPGIYEGSDAQQTTLIPHYSADEHTSSRCYELLLCLDERLRTRESSSLLLLTAMDRTDNTEENENSTHSITTPFPTACEVFKFMSDFWTELLANYSTLSRYAVISKVTQWVSDLGHEIFICNDIIIKHFTDAFVKMCSNQLQRMQTRGAQGGCVMKSAMFLNILSRQVLAVVKAACMTSANHITCIRVLEMVFVVVKITRRIDGYDPVMTEVIPVESAADDCENPSVKGVRKRVRESSNEDVKNAQHVPDDDGTCLDSCIAELDCTAPSMQHRLLEGTLDLLCGINLIDFNIIEYLLESSLFLMPCPDFVVSWVLKWFVRQDIISSTSTDGDSYMTTRASEREKGSEKERKKGKNEKGREKWKEREKNESENYPYRVLQPPVTSLKSSILISNILRNSLHLFSAGFLSRLFPRTLFQVGYHSLRAENIELFMKVKTLLGEQSLYGAVLSVHYEDFALSSVQEEYHVSSKTAESGNAAHKKGNDVQVFPLVEDINSLSTAGDGMIKRFLESLNAYRIANKKSADFSSFVPKELGYFPFQSLTLFAENLTDLNLSNNYLKKFPESVLFFFKLRKLNISKNEFQSLPESFGKYLQELRILDLGQNLLTSFPTCILELKNLEELMLGDNLLEYIPAQIQGLPKLQHMDISGNRLKVFSTDLANIRFLKT